MTSDRRVVGLAVAATVAAVVPAFLVGALAVQIRADLDFGTGRLGLALAAFGATAACGSIVLGRAVETWGPYRSLRLAVAANGVVMIAVAALARSWAVLVVLLAVAGIGNALAQPAANALLARGVRDHRLGLAFGAKQAALPLSTLLAGAAVPLIALTVGWRWAFAVAAALSAAVVVALMRAEPLAAPSPAGSDGARTPLPHVALGVLAVAVGLGAAAASSLVTFLVSSAVHAGLSPAAAGWLLSAGSAIGIASRLAAGAAADRRSGRHLLVVVGMLAGGAVAFTLYAIDQAWLYVAVTPLAFGAGWAWPGLFNFAIVRLHPSAPGAATGITQTGTYVGLVIGPLTFGALVDVASYEAAWLVTSAWALTAAACMVVGRQLLRAARRQSPLNSGRPRTPMS